MSQGRRKAGEIVANGERWGITQGRRSAGQTALWWKWLRPPGLPVKASSVRPEIWWFPWGLGPGSGLAEQINREDVLVLNTFTYVYLHELKRTHTYNTNTKRCTCDVDNTITPLGGSWRKDGFCLICGDRDPGNISEGQVVGIVLMSQLWCGTMGRKVWTCVLWMCFQCRFKNPHKGLMERTPYKIFFKELNHKKTSNTLKRKLQISTEKMDNSDSQKNIYI